MRYKTSKHNFTIVTVIPNQTTYNLIPPAYMQRIEHTSHIKTTFFYTHNFVYSFLMVMIMIVTYVRQKILFLVTGLPLGHINSLANLFPLHHTLGCNLKEQHTTFELLTNYLWVNSQCNVHKKLS